MSDLLRNPIFVLLLLASCATISKLDSEEYQYRARVDEANWSNCSAVYRAQGKYVVSNHTHAKRVHKPQEIRDDLFMNACKAVLGEEWLDY